MNAGLVAVRHAAVLGSGICHGRAECEVALSPGDAAREILRAAACKPDVVWSSPSRRCHDPAVLIAKQAGAELRLDTRLYELSFGRWEGKRWSDIETESPAELQRWMQDWLNVAPPDGESAREIESRVRSWFLDLDRRQLHLLVAHAGVIRALRVVAGGGAWETAMMQEVPYLGAERFGRLTV